MEYIIREREAGNIIDVFDTLEEAKKALKNYEEQDKAEGTYTEDFYEIVKIKVLFPTDEIVCIDENETVNIEIPAEYEEIAVTTDSRVIAYDEAVGGWIELGRNN